MTPLELNEANAVDLDKRVFDPELRYIETPRLLKTCGPLLKLKREIGDHRTEVVRFCHESVRAYLVSNRFSESLIHFQVKKFSANACLAKTCLVYMIHFFSLDIMQLKKDYELTNYPPLLQYALDRWPGHYRQVIGHDQQEELDGLAYKLQSLKNIEEAFSIYGRWIEFISPIYYSALVGITGAVSMLLKEGVDPNEPPFGRWGTALGAACHAGHEDIVELLVEYGAEVETSSADGWTPLHLAAETIGPRLVTILIENGTEDYVDRRDSEGCTALHFAARRGEEETVQLLLDNGADVLAADNEDFTPLDMALSRGREEIVRLLVNHGADVDAFHGKYGTRLRHAARSGDERAVKILLKLGANPNLYWDPKPFPRYPPGTPLQEAIYYEKEGIIGHENIVKLLLEAGANPNGHALVPDSALHWAAGAGNSKIVKWLLEAGADVNAAESGHESPLKAAVSARREEVVRLLLAAGADPNAQDSSPTQTPLGWAISRKEPVLEQLLRDHGATDY